MDEDHDGNLVGARTGQAQLTREGDGSPLRLTEQDLLTRERDRIEWDQTHAHLGEGGAAVRARTSASRTVTTRTRWMRDFGWSMTYLLIDKIDQMMSEIGFIAGFT